MVYCRLVIGVGWEDGCNFFFFPTLLNVTDVNTMMAIMSDYAKIVSIQNSVCVRERESGSIVVCERGRESGSIEYVRERERQRDKYSV